MSYPQLYPLSLRHSLSIENALLVRVKINLIFETGPKCAPLKRFKLLWDAKGLGFLVAYCILKLSSFFSLFMSFIQSYSLQSCMVSHLFTDNRLIDELYNELLPAHSNSGDMWGIAASNWLFIEMLPISERCLYVVPTQKPSDIPYLLLSAPTALLLTP